MHIHALLFFVVLKSVVAILGEPPRAPHSSTSKLVRAIPTSTVRPSFNLWGYCAGSCKNYLEHLPQCCSLWSGGHACTDYWGLSSNQYHEIYSCFCSGGTLPHANDCMRCIHAASDTDPNDSWLVDTYHEFCDHGTSWQPNSASYSLFVGGYVDDLDRLHAPTESYYWVNTVTPTPLSTPHPTQSQTPTPTPKPNSSSDGPDVITVVTSTTTLSPKSTTTPPPPAFPSSLLTQLPLNWPYTTYGIGRRAGQSATSTLTYDADGKAAAVVVASLQWYPRPIGNQKPQIPIPNVNVHAIFTTAATASGAGSTAVPSYKYLAVSDDSV